MPKPAAAIVAILALSTSLAAAGTDRSLVHRIGLSNDAQAEAADLDDIREAFRRDHEIDYPDDNVPNAARSELGKALFFDPRLSRSGGQSCASCHNPAFAWGDGLAVGRGDNLQPLARRSPSILNLAWGEPLMWDGRAESLEDQALGPLLSGAEMNMPLDDLLATLQGIPGYAPMFAAAFDGDATITPDRVALAIAAYERTIISGQAPFDDWVEGDDDAISDAAKRGLALFAGKGSAKWPINTVTTGPQPPLESIVGAAAQLSHC